MSRFEINQDSFTILDQFLDQIPDRARVLEIGPAQFHHTKHILKDKKVGSIDIVEKHTQTEILWEEDIFVSLIFKDVKDLPRANLIYDGIWCSHVLEHIYDVHTFLSIIYKKLNVDGVLGLIVPPLKHNLVGGHINLFTPLTLVYNLILAGFDCSNPIAFGTLGYNNYIILKKKPSNISEIELISGKGDIEKLSHLFPYPVKQGTIPNGTSS